MYTHLFLVAKEAAGSGDDAGALAMHKRPLGLARALMNKVLYGEGPVATVLAEMGWTIVCVLQRSKASWKTFNIFSPPSLLLMDPPTLITEVFRRTEAFWTATMQAPPHPDTSPSTTDSSVPTPVARQPMPFPPRTLHAAGAFQWLPT